MFRVYRIPIRNLREIAPFVLIGLVSAIVNGNAVAQPTAMAPTEISLREKEVTLKEQELKFKMQKADSTKTVEYWKVVSTFASVLVASLGLGIPLYVAIKTLDTQRGIANDQTTAQRTLSKEQARLQFQMKAAELALSTSGNAMQAREKARALAALFGSELLPSGFAESFDPNRFRLEYGNSTNRRMEVIKLVAEYPSQRDQILKDWYVLFRWDWWWIEPLLELNEDDKKKLRLLQERLVANEKEVNSKMSEPRQKAT